VPKKLIAQLNGKGKGELEFFLTNEQKMHAHSHLFIDDCL